MDFHALPRRDLQTLCKRNKIPANMTNVAMADALQALPAVEGLEALIQDAQQYLSPHKAAGMPEAPSRSCRRTASTRKQPNPPGSSVPRTRRAGKNQAAAEEKEADDVVVLGVGIPNSPTTLNSRGRRTRTLVIAGCRETEEEEVEAVKKVEPLPLEIPKTPATRTTRGRRAANQEMALKHDEDGAPAVPQTPGATTARRASTRRAGGARAAAPAQEEASGARSTRYRTRRAVVEEAAAETETAARTRTTAASRKNSKKAAAGGGDVSGAGEDGAEGEAPAGEVVAAGGGAAEAEIFLPVPEMDGSDGLRVDQTMDTNPTDVIVVEEAGSEGVDQTVVEDTISEDPAIVEPEVSMVDSIDQTMDKAEEIADQTVVVEESHDSTVGDAPSDQTAAKESIDQTVEVDESHDSTVGDAPSDQTAAEETILDDPTVVDEEGPLMDSIEQTMDRADEPADQTVEVEESHDSTVGAPSDDQGVVEEKEGSFEGHVDQTAVEELILNITAISLDSTVDEEEIPVAVVWEDQTAHDGSDLVPVEVEGHVDPTVQEIQVSVVDCDVEKIDPTVGDGDETQVSIVDSDAEIIDPTAEDGDEISACDGDVEKIDPTVGGDGDETRVSIVDSDAETIDLTAEEGDEISACDAAFPEETPMVGDSDVAGVLASLATDVVVVSAGDEIIPAETEEQGEEEKNKEEETQQQPSMGGDASTGDEIIPAEAEEQGEEEKDREEETQQQPSTSLSSFLLGEQDKENAAAVKACLMSPTPKQNQQMAAAVVVKYDNTTSLRKLKAAYKDVCEEKQKKRAALAALDDNCITSPGQFF